MCVDVNGVVVGIIPAGSGGAVDPVELTTSQPTAPAADKVKIFGSNVGGRMMPAFIGPSGLNSSLQPSFARNAIAYARAIGNSIAITTEAIAWTVVGTQTAAAVGTSNIQIAMRRVNYNFTTATTTAVAGFRSAALQFFRGDVVNAKLGGFHFVCRFGPSLGAAANTTRRGFVGFTSLTTAPTDANPSGLPNILGVGCDNTDTTYHIMYKSGTTTATKINTGIVKSAADYTEMYELAMFCAPGGTQVHFEFTNLATGVVFRHTATTNLPLINQLLAPSGYYSVGGTSSAIGIAFSSLYIETDF
jgi:hypothetical protein